MTSRSSSSLLLCALLLLLAAPALGAGAKQDAFREHFDKAMKLYQSEQIEESIQEFQAAYALRQLPRLLLNIGQAYRKLGRAKDALGFYEFYLRVEPNPKPEVKTELETFIKQTKSMIDVAEKMKATREAEERAARGEPPLPDPVKEPPPASAEAQKPATPATPVTPAQPAPNLAPAAPTPAPAPVVATAVTPAPRTPVYKKWWFWTAIVGGAAVVTGAVVAGVVLSSPHPPPLPDNIGTPRDQSFSLVIR